MADGGYRSHEATWIGGISAPSTATIGGYFSHEAFWMGGIGAIPVTPPTPILIAGRGGGWKTIPAPVPRYKKIDPQEEAIAILLLNLLDDN